MTAIKGTCSAAPASSRREAWRTRPPCSAAGPTMKPGVSISESTGMPKLLQSSRKRAPLSDALLVRAPAICMVLLAIRPIARPHATQRDCKLRRVALLQEGDRARVADRLDDGRNLVGASLTLGDRRTQRLLRGLLAGGHGALEVGEQALGRRDRLALILNRDIDDAVGALHGEWTDLLRRHLAEAAAGDHRRPAHAEMAALRRDDQV